MSKLPQKMDNFWLVVKSMDGWILRLFHKTPILFFVVLFQQDSLTTISFPLLAQIAYLIIKKFSLIIIR